MFASIIQYPDIEHVDFKILSLFLDDYFSKINLVDIRPFFKYLNP